MAAKRVGKLSSSNIGFLFFKEIDFFPPDFRINAATELL